MFHVFLLRTDLVLVSAEPVQVQRSSLQFVSIFTVVHRWGDAPAAEETIVLLIVDENRESSCRTRPSATSEQMDLRFCHLNRSGLFFYFKIYLAADGALWLANGGDLPSSRLLIGCQRFLSLRASCICLLSSAMIRSSCVYTPVLSSVSLSSSRRLRCSSALSFRLELGAGSNRSSCFFNLKVKSSSLRSLF